jgi:hypothetical protein
MPAAVRASIGPGSSSGNLDQFVDALTDISATGPRWTYQGYASRFTELVIDAHDASSIAHPARGPILHEDMERASPARRAIPVEASLWGPGSLIGVPGILRLDLAIGRSSRRGCYLTDGR